MKTMSKTPLHKRKMQDRLFQQIKDSSWFAGGHWQAGVGTVCGNYEYPELFDEHLAQRIINQKNQWSILLVAHLDAGRGVFVKAEQLEPLANHVSRLEAERYVEPELHRFAGSQNRNHLISASWFMVPVPGVDLIGQIEAINDLLRAEGAADRLTCHLSSERRIKEIERLDADDRLSTTANR